MNGFKINGLFALGKIVPIKKILFQNGLNIVTGPSDTGKTYIFEAINYMLGSGNKPKNIEEAKHYTTMFLEIEIYDTGKIFTFERSILNEKQNITVYYSPFVEIDQAKNEELYYRHSKTYENNISTFLLEMCNFVLPIQTRTNTDYKKDSFTFRSMVPYSMVSEIKMIEKSSPIYATNSRTDKTKYLYHFKYLLTNKDDSNVEEALGTKVFSAKKNASLELLSKLLDEESDKKDKLEGKLNESVELNDKDYTENLLRNIQQDITSINKQIRDLEKRKSSELASINYNQSLLNRFELLEKQYLSDIERLSFIDEGSFLIEQLLVKRCPHCNKPIDMPHNDCESINVDDISDACVYEINQLDLKLKDLKRSIFTTNEYISSGKEKLLEVEKEISSYTLELNKNLNPEFTTLKKKMLEINSIDHLKAEIDLTEEKIDQYERLISEFREKKDLKYSSPNKFALGIINETMFGNYLTSTIQSFLYSENDTIDIEFFLNDYREIDFSVDNDNRINKGKGSRALLASAFYLALRNYCHEKGLAHTNFIILDSPINPFKEKDEESEKNSVSSSVKKRFLTYLARDLKSFQTIMLENFDYKDLAKDIKNEINIIEFTKSSVGRYGFY